MKIIRALTLLSILVLGFGVSTQAREGISTQPNGSRLSIDLQNPSIASLRLEIFDASSAEKLWDSGVRSGDALVVSAADLDRVKVEGSVQYELRAWDHAGDLVLSQVSNLASRGVDEIFSIDFEMIPAGTRVVGATIHLDGDVEVAGSLSASELRKPGGAAFFQACPSGQSIRVIQPDGSVSCEVVPTSSGGDNLGNHQATQTLVMGNDWIEFSPAFGLRTTAGAELRTGLLGETFQFQAGNGVSAPGSASIAHFRDDTDELALGVLQEGVLEFFKGQKVCSVYGANGRHNILASASWTASTCDTYRDAVGATNFQLFCVFENSFTFGTAGGGTPPTNCGW